MTERTLFYRIFYNPGDPPTPAFIIGPTFDLEIEDKVWGEGDLKCIERKYYIILRKETNET